MNMSAEPQRRSYRQRARAEQAEQTGLRILTASLELFVEQGYAGASLTAVAERAGVTTQTVIRRFGDKEGLVAATAIHATAAIEAQRSEAPAGDVDAAVSNLLEHYEEFAPVSLRLLADEEASPQIGALVAGARSLHRDWCARVFAPQLAPLTAAARRRRLAQLVAICDVYTWKLLRHDAGLSVAQTRLALVEMLTALTGAPPTDRRH